MVKKSEQVAAMIRERIEHGSYYTGVLPSLRELAAELGVNYLTVRQGLHQLREEGCIGTSRNRKFSILEAATPTRELRVALLEGACDGTLSMRLLSQAVHRRNGTVRRFIFSHPNDELLTQVPDMNFDLIFFHLDPHDITPMVLAKFTACRERMVSIHYDYVQYGIRSIMEPAVERSITILFEELEKHHHQRYDILAPQETSDIVERRINAFRLAAVAAGKVCNTHRYQMPPYMFDVNLARQAAKQVFSPALPPDAVFVPTIFPALGVMRGLFDLGWLAGRDYSLVSSGDRDLASMAIPAVMITTSEDLLPVFTEVLATPPDSGKLEFYLNEPELFRGESVIDHERNHAKQGR